MSIESKQIWICTCDNCGKELKTESKQKTMFWNSFDIVHVNHENEKKTVVKRIVLCNDCGGASISYYYQKKNIIKSCANWLSSFLKKKE